MFKITDEVSGKFANMAVISTVMIVFHHLPRHAPEGVVSVYDAILQIHPIVLMAVPFFSFLQDSFWLGTAMKKNGGRLRSLNESRHYLHICW